MVSPDWLSCCIYDYLLKKTIFQKDIYISKSNILLDEVIDHAVRSLFIYARKILLDKMHYLFLELVSYNISSAFLKFHFPDIDFRDKFFSDLLKDKLGAWAYIKYIDIIP